MGGFLCDGVELLSSQWVIKFSCGCSPLPLKGNAMLVIFPRVSNNLSAVIITSSSKNLRKKCEIETHA